MIVVTGGAGFIGSNLVAALEERGHAVAVCDMLGTGDKWIDDEIGRMQDQYPKHVVHLSRFDEKLARRIYAGAEIALLLLIPLGSMHYRCAGHDGSDSFGLDLRHDHAMLHDLGIHETCPLPVNKPRGWWPDVLPER